MPQPAQKLFLLDAFALIYRAHFAFIKAPRITSSGMNTSAVFGFANTLLEVLKKEAPTHIGVAFDTPKKTFRHEQFIDYKAQREAQPEDITIAVPYVKRLLEAMNIPILLVDGFEADDVIGTLARCAAEEGFEVFMMTPDKDYGQLVQEHVYMYKPPFMGNKAEKMGVAEILDKWQIERVDQVIDMLGLMGDASDNIPGVPGVGEKTAQKLIAEYGSLENILAQAGEIKGKLGERIRENADQAIMSKQLATIDVNVPIPFSALDLILEEPDADKVNALFDELEFRTLRHRVLGDAPLSSSNSTAKTPAKGKPGQLDLFGAASNPDIAAFESSTSSNQTEPISVVYRTIATARHDYQTVDTPELMASLIHYLGQQEAFCFDTETTALDALQAELVGIAFAYRAGEAFYVPVPPEREKAQAIVEVFRPVFENEKVMKIGQNLKYDMLVLKNYNLEIQGPLADTMLAHYLLEPEQRHGMDRLAVNYLNYEPVAIEELIGKKGKNQGTMRGVPVGEVTEYAGEDADITLQLYQLLLPELQEKAANKLFESVEMPLVRVLTAMESEGVRVDTDALSKMSKELENDIKLLETDIFATAETEFNLNSPKQLGEVLFDKMNLVKNPKKTPTGQYATGEDILSALESEHEIARKILDYRELQKLKSTYVDALPLLINPNTGRIHTSYNQAVTATGRLSSTNPNLQNIPIRTVRGREIRKAFVPRSEEFQILSADYSQIELRIMAAFSGDPSMIEAFNLGRDIHATTASKVFKIPLEEVTGDMRRQAKSVNFGIIYGISAFGLAKNLGISRTDAGDIIKAYFEEFPAVKAYMDRVIVEAREREYVETILGRRRYLADINSRNQTNRGFAERNAINAPIQGSAADMIKLAMINIQAFIEKEQLRSRMILQVHDELVFDAYREELDFLKTNVENLMQNALPMEVKMETGIGIGNNWLEAH